LSLSFLILGCGLEEREEEEEEEGVVAEEEQNYQAKGSRTSMPIPQKDIFLYLRSRHTTAWEEEAVEEVE
jgi:hypothetical protein